MAVRPRGPGAMLGDAKDYPFPSRKRLEVNKEEFLAYQALLSAALLKNSHKAAAKKPPCVNCHPKLVWYCQEEEQECWKFVKYCHE